MAIPNSSRSERVGVGVSALRGNVTRAHTAEFLPLYLVGMLTRNCTVSMPGFLS